MFKFNVIMGRSEVKSGSHHDVAHLLPQLMPYQVSTSYTLRMPRFCLSKILNLKITRESSKVKSGSDYDDAHLHSLTNVPTNYQPYNF